MNPLTAAVVESSPLTFAVLTDPTTTGCPLQVRVAVRPVQTNDPAEADNLWAIENPAALPTSEKAPGEVGKV